MAHLGINLDLLEQENGGHLPIPSCVVFTAVSAGFNGGCRISSCSGEGEINHAPICYLLIKTRGLRRHHRGFHYHSSPSPVPAPLPRTSFFSRRGFKRLSSTTKQQLLSGFHLNFLSIRKCFQALAIECFAFRFRYKSKENHRNM